MQVAKLFVAGLGVGAAVVAVALWLMPPSPETVANPPAAHPALPPLPGTPTPSPAVPPQEIYTTPLPVPTGPVFPAVPTASAAPPMPPEVGVAPAIVPVVKPVEEPKPKLPPGRTAVKFGGPAGMKVSWLIGSTFHDRDLAAPAAYNFVQGQLYRLRLTGMTKYPDAKFYPTLDVSAPSERVRAFLAHNAIPLTFTETELAAAVEGRLIVKAVYLPATSDGTPSAVEEVSSVRLSATGDAVAAASGRGTLLAVVRLGNVDLENPDSPPLNAPPSPDLPTKKDEPVRPAGSR
jgi:hypothetical protein